MQQTQVVKASPLKHYRLYLGLTQQELAQRAGVTTQSILKYEQGLYQEPSNKIIKALYDEANRQDVELPSFLIKDYKEWRNTRQQSAAWVFDRHHTIRLSVDRHPFRTFRMGLDPEGYSVQGFCVLLALHPQTVGAYDKSKVREMPSLIREALLNAKMPVGAVEDLNRAGIYFYDRLGL